MGKPRITFHGKKGRFCGKGDAYSVTKGGERFKVIRQHRRMKPKSPARTRTKMAKETVDLMVTARGKSNLVELMDGIPYVSLKDLLGV